MELNSSLMQINIPMVCGHSMTPSQGQWKNNAPSLDSYKNNPDQINDVIDTHKK